MENQSQEGAVPENDVIFAPGTVVLEQVQGSGHVKRIPEPSSNPNDPLNWSRWRKTVNFTVVCFYTLLVFTIFSIGPVVWTQYTIELGMNYDQLNNQYAANTAGLAVGCIIFIPFAFKYGRRPVYILSSIITFGMTVWQAKLNTYAEMVTAQVITGLSTAVSETLVQMTLADMFFVHQRATMNGVYLMMVTIGSFLSPIAAGYAATNQGWRWIYWWSTIFIGLNIVLFAFCYEETKFAHQTIIGSLLPESLEPVKSASNGADNKNTPAVKDPSEVKTVHEPDIFIDHAIPMASYRQRLAWLTPTAGPARNLFCHVYLPFQILFTFPVVAFVALQYGATLAWFSIIITMQPTYFAYEPYNFNSSQLGLLSIPPFIGAILGTLFGGPLNDWSILFFARRNKGVYEPEMRLYLTCIPAVVGPVGIFLYGYGIDTASPWIIPCVGSAFFGFSMIVIGDNSLTYLSDSFQEIIGDALVAVAFVRNLLATIIVFVLTPWVNALGLHDFITCIGCLALGINLLVIPMIVWGKRSRIACLERYTMLQEMQFNPRETL